MITNHLSITDYLIHPTFALSVPASFSQMQVSFVVVLYALMFAAGYLASRKESKIKAASGMILAGRRLGSSVALFSITATWVGGGFINGTAEAIYDPNMGFFWTIAPWGYALSLIFGGVFFASKMRRRRYTTLLDPFHKRYGKKVAALLFIPAVIGEIFWSAAILLALGGTFSFIMGIEPFWGILISSAIAVLYTSMGGLIAVAYTDVLQLLLIIVGLGCALPVALSNTGGLNYVLQDYRETMPVFPEGESFWSWLDLVFLLVLGGIPWQGYFQRVLACKDSRSVKGISAIAGLGCLVLAVPPMIFGLIASTVNWAEWGVEAPSPSMVLPYVLAYLTNPLIAVIGLSAVVAAVMSSVDSSILAVSSLFTWNVYKPYFGKDASDEQMRRVVKYSVFVSGGVATVLALNIGSIYTLWYLSADLVYVLLFPQLFLCLYFPMMNAPSVMTGLLAGLFVRIFAETGLMFSCGILSFMENPEFFPYRTVAMLANLGTSILVAWALSIKKQRRSIKTT